MIHLWYISLTDYFGLARSQIDYILLTASDVQKCSTGSVTVFPPDKALFDVRSVTCESQLYFQTAVKTDAAEGAWYSTTRHLPCCGMEMCGFSIYRVGDNSPSDVHETTHGKRIPRCFPVQAWFGTPPYALSQPARFELCPIYTEERVPTSTHCKCTRPKNSQY